MSRNLSNGLWLTEHRGSGKMINMDSIMLSHPSFCLSRSVGVCTRCYSKKLSGYRPELAKRQLQNTFVLSNPDFEPCKLNTANGALRWASFGELTDSVMYNSICKMVDANPHILHVIWTKRNGIIKSRVKPHCLKLVWSATKLDVKKPFVPGGYDMAFYVYTSAEKIPTGKYWDKIHICRGNCSDCMHCYKKNSSGIISEVIR